MGTSSSHSGPGDGPGLLPSWATNGQAGDADIAGGATGAPDEAEGQAADGDATDVGGPAMAPTPTANWRNAKASMTRYARSGGGGSNSSRLRSAGAGYTRAKGGSRSAAGAARSGKAATGRLGGFLASTVGSGVGPALESVGLREVVGQSSEIVFARLVDKLAPSGSTKEEAAARRATIEVLSYLYETVVGENGEMASLEGMDADTVEYAVELSVSGYIYNMWLDELGLSIEKGAVSEAAAIRLEGEVREYVKLCVSLELGGTSVLDINWRGSEGRGIIDRVFNDAYSVLEAAV